MSATRGERLPAGAIYVGATDEASLREVDERIERQRVERESGRPVREREALDAIWRHFADDDPAHGWDPRSADGCWPEDCTCGFVAAMEQVRAALAATGAPEPPDEAVRACNHFPGQTVCDWCRPTGAPLDPTEADFDHEADCDCPCHNAEARGARTGAPARDEPGIDPSLDAAWKEAEAALGEYWRVRSLTDVGPKWETVATDGHRIASAAGATPVAALKALASKLRAAT